MAVQELKFVYIVLAIIGILISLLIKIWFKSWYRFGIILIPLILVGNIITNLIWFPAINQGDRWQLQRLPSNELIDLYNTSITPFKAGWIYSLVELYYQGRTLLIPDDVLDSLDISRELLQTQGQLAEVVPVDLDRKLTENEVEMILDLEGDKILMNDGNLYHFVTGGVDQKSPLLLLKYENQLFFIPGDLLSDWESSL